MKQKQSAPYWPTLVILCTSLSNRRHDASSNEEEEEEEAVEAEEGVRGLMEENLQLLEEVYKHLCGALQGRRERVRRTPATVCGSCISCIGLTLLNQIKVNI